MTLFDTTKGGDVAINTPLSPLSHMEARVCLKSWASIHPPNRKALDAATSPI